MSGTSLNALRGALSTSGRAFLTEIWSYFVERENWPTTRLFHSRHGKAKVVQTLKSVGGSIVCEVGGHQGESCYQLSTLGVLLTDSGTDYQSFLLKYLEFQRRVFQTDPEKTSVTSHDVSDGTNLSAGEIKLLGLLLWLSPFLSGGGRSPDGTWTASTLKEAEDYPMDGDLTPVLEARLLKHYEPSAPVALEARWAARSSFADAPSAFGRIATYERPKLSEVLPNAMNRRYQVFVSSTYTDLIEERRHAMQALLETKCIPTGMEMFPASSSEQWKVIQRIIDDCDYYLVIVAGRYGSLTPEGLSYTEREFDYATSAGKSTLAFYHADIKTLPGSKLEELDEMKHRLKAFTAKVKNRLCHSWITPEGLGSAIKSAVFEAIEYDPKPGWVRANAVPSHETVSKLMQRVADLEQELNRKQS